ncbi:deoxyribonuclease IV [Melioribacteraceae bacterium 4301-Me]|uniref:deoxyribonuclease IV n=1 Tax=Pyranulibacter aquaticus TaxID=3163344 RepID=UPI0035983505
MTHLLGAHTFVTGGPASAIDTAEKLGFTAIQIFTKNNNQYFAKDLSEKEINDFKSKLLASNIKFVVSHDSYLINLCSKDPMMLKKSREAFLKELERCEQLGIPYLNFHPGAHGGQGEELGIKLIAESLNIVHQKTKGYKTKSMLEATAGQGTALGYRFEQLRKIIDLVEEPERMSVCIDTAHIFAAGYDIRDSKQYKKVIKEFNDIIGLEKLKCIHMNDSKKELGSRVDRHEHIGKGFIGTEGFTNIMNDKKLERVPKILETPKGKDQKEDLQNIKLLLSLVKK